MFPVTNERGGATFADTDRPRLAETDGVVVDFDYL